MSEGGTKGTDTKHRDTVLFIYKEVGTTIFRNEMASLDSLTLELSALRADVKALTKLVRKVKMTQEDPTGEKAKARSKNNVFNKPVVLSPELRSFFGVTEDTVVTRADVTRRMSTYVKENNLKNKETKLIELDHRMKVLLNPPDDFMCTGILKLQPYLKVHYLGNPEAVSTDPVDPEAPKQDEDAEGAAAEGAPKEKKKRPVVKKPSA